MTRRRPPTLNDLWTSLEQDTGRAVTPAEREWLASERLTAIALEEEEREGYSECRDKLKIFRKAVAEGVRERLPQGGRFASKATLGMEEGKHSSAGSGWASSLDRERSRALALHVARHATSDPLVRLLRGQLLGDPEAIMSEVQQRALLGKAASCTPLAVFEEHGIPVWAHESSLVESHSHTSVAEDYRDVRIRIRWGDREFIDERRLVIRDRDGTPPLIEISWSTLDGVPHRMRTFPGSPLRLLANGCRNLAPDYGWTEDEAARFVLHAIAPMIKPVQANVRVHNEGTCPRAEIVLVLQPFVGPKAAARAFSTLRSTLFTNDDLTESCTICGRPRTGSRACTGSTGQDGAYCSVEKAAGKLPKDPETQLFKHDLRNSCGCGRNHAKELDHRQRRPGPKLSERSLAVFTFVERALAQQSVSVSSLTRLWNEFVSGEHPSWRYGRGTDDGRRNFTRDYRRAKQLIIGSPLPYRFHDSG